MLDPARRRIKNPRSPFCWEREASYFDVNVVLYRLHYRDQKISWAFDIEARRSEVARQLKVLRKELRGQ